MNKALILLVVIAVAFTTADNIPGMERVLPKSNLCKLLFSTGFESWDDFTNNNYPINPTPAAGSISAENVDTMTSLTLSNTVYKSGSRSLQATSLGYGNDSHAAFPTVLLSAMNDIAQFTPIYTEMQIYFEKPVPKGLWSTIASFGNDYQNKRQVSVNLDENMMVQLYGVPFQFQNSWSYQNESAVMPVGKWANLTIYLDFNPLKGIAAVWIDSVLASVANVQNVNGGVYTANWGMFQSKWIGEGSVYNDDLRIWSVGASCKGATSGNGGDLIIASTSSITAITSLVAILLAILAIVF
jgi:hypothetical protein